MKKTFTILIAAIAAILMMALPEKVVGQVVSGTTYSTPNTGGLPTNWSGAGNSSGSYMNLNDSNNYIQTSNFTQYGFTNIKLKARTYGSPNTTQGTITVSWYNSTSKAETVLGTILPTTNKLAEYNISSPASVSAGAGYIKIQCKGASSSKGSGVSEVTITYRTCNPSTSTLAFGDVAVGGSSTKSFTLTTATLASSLTLTPSPGYTVDPNSILSNATSTTVYVTCSPTATGTQNGTLTISGGSLTSNVVVDLIATGITPSSDPSCSVDPDIYDFESVAVNGTKSHTFTVTTANLTEDIALSMSSDKYTVEPNEIAQNVTSTEVTITFLPTATGPVEAYLRVNGSGFEYERVALVSGTGATPYTITLHPGTGSCAPASMSGISGATINLPAATPSSACSAMGWEFYGWATSSIEESTSIPSIVNNSYTISGDTDLYAVYRDGGSVTFNFADLAAANGWTNGTAYTSIELSPITLEAQGGGNNGKYYTSDKTWRMYNGGTVAISSDSGPINSVSSSPSKTFTISNGSASLSCTETINFASISVSYGAATPSYATSPSCTPTCVTPSFTITGVKKTDDTYYVTANVALSSTTEGASIYYTLNGDTPTSGSTLYEAPFDITDTKTIKAIAIKDGYNNSIVAEKTITIVQPNVATFTDGVYSDLNSTSHLGSFYTYSVSGDEYWYWNTSYTCAYIKGNSNTNEDWLISPKMNSVNKLAITFKAVGKDGNSSTITVLYSTDYPGYGNPNSSTWNSITTSPTVPTSASSWTFQDISCSIPVSGDVYIAFKYISSSTNSGQFEMKEFTAKQCYPITYNNNKGSGTITDTNSPYAVGTQVTIKSSEGFSAPAESGKVFERWNTSADGEGTSYMPDDKVTMGTSAVELFAIWVTPCTEYAELGGTTITPTYVNDGGDKSYSLEFKSKVTALGGCDITDYGFVYSTSVESPAIGTANCTKQKIGEEYTTVNTEYTYNGITGVDEGTTYYVRSYAINAAGTAYGAVASITTEDFPTWTITYNENGNTSHTQIIDRGDTEDLEEPANAAPANMTFAGWAENPITKFSESAPTFVTEYEATANKTFYAVYEYNCPTGEITKGWKRVDNASSLAKDDLLVIASETKGKVAGSTISSGYMSEATADFNNGIMTNLGSGAAQLTLGGSSGAWTLTNSSSQALGATALKAVAWGSGTTTWSISISDGAATIQNGTSSYGRFLHNVNSTRFTTYTSAPNASMLLPQIYRYEDIAATKSYYVTSVTELAEATTIAVSTTTTLDHNVTINSNEYTVNGTLDANGYLIANKTANKIVVNNGGQLKVSNAVKATVKKDITQNWVPASGIGWYTISTPTGSTGFGDVENLKPMDGFNRLYDIYRYKESTMTWENSIEAGFDNDRFEEGRGYLYRKGNTSALEFAGPVNIATSYKQALTVTGETEIAGFALLGNPYSHNITLKHVVAEGNTLDECYVLTGENAWITKLTAENDDEIAPCQGFLVQATTAGDAYIHKTAQSSKGRANNDYIKFIVANSQYEDVTFALFDEGHGLNKINHRNSNIQKIYIPKDGESFAVATMADNTQSFNLNFKAMTMGQYTLSFKTKGEFNYLHVIDRMTGDDIDMLLEGEYSFVGSPQDDEARFIVRLGYLPNYDDNGENIFAYQNGSDVIVSGEGELQIFDVMGRMVSTQNVNGTETISVNAQGVYIFRLVGSEIKTQKIIIK